MGRWLISLQLKAPLLYLVARQTSGLFPVYENQTKVGWWLLWTYCSLKERSSVDRNLRRWLISLKLATLSLSAARKISEVSSWIQDLDDCNNLKTSEQLLSAIPHPPCCPLRRELPPLCCPPFLLPAKPHCLGMFSRQQEHFNMSHQERKKNKKLGFMIAWHILAKRESIKSKEEAKWIKALFEMCSFWNSCHRFSTKLVQALCFLGCSYKFCLFGLIK